MYIYMIYIYIYICILYIYIYIYIYISYIYICVICDHGTSKRSSGEALALDGLLPLAVAMPIVIAAVVADVSDKRACS